MAINDNMIIGMLMKEKLRARRTCRKSLRWGVERGRLMAAAS